MMAEEPKTLLNASKEQEFKLETEINDEVPAKPRITKPNNLPASILILAFILANLEVSKGLTCPKDSDIKWISNITNKFLGCTPCQPCPPSQEFSIPCGTEAYTGTVSECIPCPSGKFSDGFNTKPCVSCSRCSNRIVKQNCTLSQNSVCGDCKPGYYLENPLFGCIKCSKCCNDGRDETHEGCSSVNLCKVRPNGCPIMPTTKLLPTSSISKASTSSGKPNTTPWSLLTKKSFITPEVNNQTLKHSSGTSQSDSGMIDETTAALVYENQKSEHIASSTAQQSTKNRFINVHNPWFIVSVVFIFVTVIALIIFVAILTIKYRKVKKSHKSAAVESADHEYEPVNQDPNSSQMELNEDQTLEQFMEENYDTVDRICKLLLHKHLGQFDFERLALEWKIPKEDIEYIKSVIHNEQGSPVRKLLEVLHTQRLCTTVRQLADSIKEINNEAYKVLKPHISKPKNSIRR